MPAEEKFLDDIGDAPAAPEPAAKPEAKPEAEAPVKAEAEPTERADPANSPARPEGYVPRQALEEARREAKEHRERAAILEDRTNKILERYFGDNQPKQAARPEEPSEPEWDENPIEAGKYARQKIAHLENVIQNFLHDNQQRTEEQQQKMALARAAQTDIARFKAQAADYDDAYAFWRGNRAAELAAYGQPPEQIPDFIEREEFAIAQDALQRGISPAEILYNVAKHRGYQAKAAAAEPAADVEIKRDPTTGQFLPAEQEKAARIKTSQERNGSLGAAPGAPVEKMTAAELAKLPEDEIWRRFDSVKNSKNKKEFDRRMNFS